MILREGKASVAPVSIISPDRLASTIRSHCDSDLPGLEALLSAALALSVTPEEGRYPRVHIRTSYQKSVPFVLELDLPLEKLADIAPAVDYAECAVLCSWTGEWRISGVTQASVRHDGIGLDITAPLCMSITRPDSRHAMLRMIRGQISEPENWETAIASLSAAVTPKAIGGTRAYVLAKAAYRASMEGHGGAFLILPPDPESCLMDISIRFPATPGYWFYDLRPLPGPTELIEDCAQALLALTRVDGAVVMDKDLLPRGFGATITASTDDESQFAHGGHRHRSAMTLCKKHTGIIAVVVSQDGPITVYGTRPS